MNRQTAATRTANAHMHAPSNIVPGKLKCDPTCWSTQPIYQKDSRKDGLPTDFKVVHRDNCECA